MQSLRSGEEARGASRLAHWLIFVIAAGLPLFTIFQLLDLGGFFGLHIPYGAYYAAFLGLFLLLIFLREPAVRGTTKSKVPWYDYALALLGVAGPVYVILFFDQFDLKHGVGYTPLELGLGVSTTILLLEATRRVIGLPIVGVALGFILYAAFSNYFPGPFQARGYGLDRLIGSFFTPSRGIFGLPTDIASTMIIAFMLFGSLLKITGAGNWFSNIAFSLTGGVRGGPAKASVIGSSLMGAVSGSVPANIAVTGTVTIPLMKGLGYKASFAGAVEATASTGAMIMPPVMGATAFILADFTGIPYATVALAALLPGILYYVALFLQVDLEAAKLGLKGLPREQLPRIGASLKQGWYYLLPLVLLIWLIMVVHYSPQTSALYASVAIILVSMLDKKARLTPRRMLFALKDTSYVMFPVIASCAVAGIIMESLGLTGLGPKLSRVLIDMSGGNTFLLLALAAVTCTVLGMGVPVTASYIMLAILVAPALTDLGLNLLASHLFIFYFGVLSFITPPVSPAIFVAMPIAGSSLWGTGFQAMRLAIVAYLVPFAFIYSPALILSGSPQEIALSFIFALIGVGALAIGLEGYAIDPLKWFERGAFLVGGVAMFAPGLPSKLIGVLALVVAVALLYGRRRLRRGKA